MLHQNKHAKGQMTPPQAFTAGVQMVAMFSHTFDRDFTAASDKLEIGVLPAEVRVTGATLVGEGLGAITADVGLMSGEPGAKDDTRAVGSEMFDAQSVDDTEADMTTLAALGITPADGHRGIGVTLSGNVAAGAAKKLTLVLHYTY